MSTGRVLPDAEAAHGYLHRICFKTGPPGVVGAELEWMVARTADRRARAPISTLKSLLADAGPVSRPQCRDLRAGGAGSSCAPWPHRTSPAAAPPSPPTSRISSPPSALPGSPWFPRASTRSARRHDSSASPRYDAMAAYFDTVAPTSAPS